MKRAFFASMIPAAMLALPQPADCQNFYEAHNAAQSNYVGTAYSLALGNAVTALGGDLGTIGINPAGAAVAGYSQFTISPGLSGNITHSAYAPSAGANFSGSSKLSTNRFILPNIGVNFRYDWVAGHMNAFTLGLVCNTTNFFTESFCGTGAQSGPFASSKFAEMAYWANHDHLSASDMESSSVWQSELYAPYWDVITGYNSGLISRIDGQDSFVGASEVISGTQTGIPSSSSLIQKSQVVNSGSTSDIIMNMAFDFDHKWYFGFNLGVPVLSYNTTETLTETTDPIDNFPVQFTDARGQVTDTYFTRGSYRYCYDLSMSGAYLKIGFIGLPCPGLRVGAAIKTRTVYDVTCKWQYFGKSEYENGKVFGSSSENGVYDYCYESPWSFNAGVAYTFGKSGLVSVDYELTDYSSMRYSPDGMDYAYFDELNNEISTFSGVQHNLRAGIEGNISPKFSIRAGYNLVSCPEKQYADDLSDRLEYIKEFTTSYSAGLGYRTSGPLFFDLGVRCLRRPRKIFSPYQDYGEILPGSSACEFQAPRISVDSDLWSGVLTVGWRF